MEVEEASVPAHQPTSRMTVKQATDQNKKLCGKGWAWVPADSSTPAAEVFAFEPEKRQRRRKKQARAVTEMDTDMDVAPRQNRRGRMSGAAFQDAQLVDVEEKVDGFTTGSEALAGIGDKTRYLLLNAKLAALQAQAARIAQSQAEATAEAATAAGAYASSSSAAAAYHRPSVSVPTTPALPKHPPLPSPVASARQRGDERVSSSSKREIKVKSRLMGESELEPELQAALKLLRQVMEKDTDRAFVYPVDPVAVPGYHDIITNPMDLGSIKEWLETGQYEDLDHVIQDVALVWHNAFTFNGEGSYYSGRAKELKAKWEQGLVRILSRAGGSGARGSPPSAPRPSTGAGGAGGRRRGTSKSGVGASSHNAEPAAFQRVELPPTFQEKQDLKENILQLDRESLTRVIEIYHNHMGTDAENDEIEMDIDKMPTSLVRELQSFIEERRATAAAEANKAKRKASPMPGRPGKAAKKARATSILDSDDDDSSSSSDDSVDFDPSKAAAAATSGDDVFKDDIELPSPPPTASSSADQTGSQPQQQQQQQQQQTQPVTNPDAWKTVSNDPTEPNAPSAAADAAAVPDPLWSSARSEQERREEMERRQRDEEERKRQEAVREQEEARKRSEEARKQQEEAKARAERDEAAKQEEQRRLMEQKRLEDQRRREAMLAMEEDDD